MRKASPRAFTLLELLAAVTLLVVLGTMLFQVFRSASDLVEIANAKQEIYQYARAAMEFLERELGGAFTGVDADASAGIKGLRVYHQNSMGANCSRREGSQGIFFTTGIMARDTRETVPGLGANPFFGRDVNCARVAYYLNNETNQLTKACVYRSEMYDLTLATPETGGPFIRNCLVFTIEVMSRFPAEDPLLFLYRDWDSEDRSIPGVPVDPNTNLKRRRGLPQALRITMRMTDERRAMRYQWGAMDGQNKWYVPGPDAAKDYWGEEDPVVQTFRQVIYYGRRSD